MIFEILKIWQIASTQPDGFTLNLKTGKLQTTGIVSGYRETQNCFGLYGLLKCYLHARTHSNIIGGWKTDQGLQFDSCRVFRHRNRALRFAYRHKQLAIFDLDELEEIRVLS